MPDPLTILYRDSVLIAVDKPAGQLVHPTSSPQPDDLVTMKILRDQIGEQVHTPHRLDRPTSGVLLMTTDRAVSRSLRNAFDARLVKKSYLAIVQGHPESDHWTSQTDLANDKNVPQSAETEFHTVHRAENGLSLILARPRTGRYHQIRRHLLHSGHPIVGDYRYNDPATCNALGETLGTGCRMLLQAQSLILNHPLTNEPLNIQAALCPLILQAAKIKPEITKTLLESL